MTEMTYAEAARLGLKEEMERDPSVWARHRERGWKQKQPVHTNRRLLEVTRKDMARMH
jgi:hypothetical protein